MCDRLARSVRGPADERAAERGVETLRHLLLREADGVQQIEDLAGIDHDVPAEVRLVGGVVDAQLLRRRPRNEGHTITHGTTYGYYLGCRDRRTCPGGADGVTCSDAQAARKREIAAAAGIPPRVEPVDSLAASERIWELRAEGRSLREIARLTGCGHTTIAELARTGSGRRTHVTPETLQRILGATVGR